MGVFVWFLRMALSYKGRERESERVREREREF
jgi:hypothetical protein